MLVHRNLAATLLIALALSTDSPPGETINYTLSGSCKVSLGVYDSNGAQIRSLMSFIPHDAGTHSAIWDGLDFKGETVPTGTYTWKLLETLGLSSEYKQTIGTSVGHFHWPGCHNGPAGVTVDVDSDTIYMGAASTEKVGQVVAAGFNGVEKWQQDDSYDQQGALRDIAFDPTPLSMITNGKLISFPHGATYIPYLNTGDLCILNADTGDPAITRANYDSARQSGAVVAPFGPIYAHDFGANGSNVQAGFALVSTTAYPSEFSWDNSSGINAVSNLQGGVAGYPAGCNLMKDGLYWTTSAQRELFTITTGEDLKFARLRLFIGGSSACSGVSVYSGESWGDPKKQNIYDEKYNAYANKMVSVPANQCKIVDVYPATKNQINVQIVNTGNYCCIRGIEVQIAADRVDAWNGKVYLGFSPADEVWRVDPSNWSPITRTEVPDFNDMAIANDGNSILAISGDSVVRLNEGGSGHTTVISGLTSPDVISIDRRSGNIFIAEKGSSQQIKHYNSSYALLGTYGRNGGRRDGDYNPLDFLEVTGVCGDGDGGFWITEGWVGPRRTTHFSVSGGTHHLIKELYGASQFFTHSSFDRNLGNRVWFDTNVGWITEAEANWSSGAWTVRSSYPWDGKLSGRIVDMDSRNWNVRTHGGERYLCWSLNPGVMKVESANLRPRMFSETGLASQSDWTGSFLSNLYRTGAKSYVWTDADGDGGFDIGEGAACDWNSANVVWFIGQDLTYYGLYSPSGLGQPAYRLIKMQPAWNGDVPQYPSFDAAPITDLVATAELHDHWGESGGVDQYWAGTSGPLFDPKACSVDDQGGVYGLFFGGGDYYTENGDGRMGHCYKWPGTETNGTALVKWNSAGNLLWLKGLQASEQSNWVRGRLGSPTEMMGIVQNCLIVGDRIGLPFEAWTKDGLYVGGFFDNPVWNSPIWGVLPDRVYAWSKSVWDGPDSLLLANKGLCQYDMNARGDVMPYNGSDVLFSGNGWNNAPVYQISGFGSLTTQQGSVVLSATGKAATHNGTGLRASWFPNNTLSGNPTVTTVEPFVWFGTDGNKQRDLPWPNYSVIDDEFSVRLEGALEPKLTETYRFSVYLSWRVETSSMWIDERVRLWVNGTKIIDTWGNADKEVKNRSSLIELRAGLPVPITLEYKRNHTTNPEPGELHLCWESESLPIEHVPAGYLYTDVPESSSAFWQAY